VNAGRRKPISKAELRDLALARRSGLGERERAGANEAVVAVLREMIRPGEAVSLFWPIRNEIDPRPLFQQIRQVGGTVLLPAVVGREIEFRRYDANVELEPGSFGTFHPPAEAGRGDPDLIIAPLAAFDRQCNRIGYGGGFYDRATKRLDDAGRRFRYVGIAFACQEVETVPAEPYDHRLDAVVTEDGLITFVTERP
jgi:5-formyltetrahydrofolate cyclo-ligase